jgi:hypothetical protein
LYFGLAEEIGRDLERSGFTYEEAYLAGICFLNSWCYIDYVGVSLIITLLYNLAPPVFKFFYVLPHSQTDAEQWLPTAMAMHGLLQGLSDEQFQGLAWAHQSWMLFREGGVPYRGIEEFEARGFFDHCYASSKVFYDKYPQHLATVSEASIDLEDFPTWTGTAAERDASFELMRSRWGYHPSDQSLKTIESKQMRACVIFSLFCSMCKAARLQ